MIKMRRQNQVCKRDWEFCLVSRLLSRCKVSTAAKSACGLRFMRDSLSSAST
jgi:hypothetical protein